MPKPPRDEDWEDVVEQVDEALRAMNVVDPTLRDALLEGVREALDAVGGAGLGATVDVEPAVTVLEGGRGDEEDAGDAGSEAPHLQVLDGAGAPEEAPRRQTRVRVFTPSEPTGGRVETVSGPALERRGRVRVEEGQWQTVYRGGSSRFYRLFCSGGRLEVALDGELEDQLLPGQSLDVEARLVRLRSPEGTSRGTYVRVDDPS